MATTLHLGDCSTDCAQCIANCDCANCTWNKFQQQEKEATLCGACGQYYEEDQQDDDGYHSAKLCDANDEIGE